MSMDNRQSIWTLQDGHWIEILVIEPPELAQKDSGNESHESDNPPDTFESAPDTERDIAPDTQSSF